MTTETQYALHLQHPWPILQRLGQVRRADVFAAGQISDGARQFEDAVVGARRKLELVHGGLHQRLAGVVQLAEFAHFGGTHVGVAGGGVGGGVFEAGVLRETDVIRLYEEAFALALAGGFDALAHRFGWFAGSPVAELLIFDARDFDVDVDAIHQRAGDALLILGDSPRRAGAGFEAVAKITAGARIHTIAIANMGIALFSPKNGLYPALGGSSLYGTSSGPTLAPKQS